MKFGVLFIRTLRVLRAFVVRYPCSLCVLCGHPSGALLRGIALGHFVEEAFLF